MPRATRYPLNLPVRFRPEGEEGWSFGMSLNISHTGILIAAESDIDTRRPLEIEVVLPGDEEGSARVVTRGRVRRASPGAEDREHAVAVSLDAYELVRVPRHGNN